MTTTKGTLKQRLDGISIEEMPKTFQDAVRVTHQLGFKYLRIDSLCIVQGSEGDWATEAQRMQYVYTNAVLNISADSGPNSTARLGSGKRLPSGR